MKIYDLTKIKRGQLICIYEWAFAGEFGMGAMDAAAERIPVVTDIIIVTDRPTKRTIKGWMTGGEMPEPTTSEVNSLIKETFADFFELYSYKIIDILHAGDRFDHIEILPVQQYVKYMIIKSIATFKGK